MGTLNSADRSVAILSSLVALLDREDGVWSVAITVWPGPKVYPAHVHKTLYVDRYIDDDTFEAISYAAIRWSIGTNHIIDYDVGTLRGFAVIELVMDRILDPNTMEMVLMHEMGHSVGLKHNEGMDGIDTLMYPDVILAADFITVTDRENFCKLYGCDPK
ncbi:unnamed protein product [Sphagnum balticum]